MENKIIIKSADDTDLPVYVYEPKGIRIGAIVLIQEIFGVTNHLKSVAEKFSNEGFIVWVPEIYHRLDGNIQLEYDITSVTEGKRLKKECGWDLPVMDILACVGNLKISHSVSLVGFCYGGSLAWKSACLGYGLNCAVSFYGSQIPDFLHLDSKCPILVHLGEKDETINEEAQKKITDYSLESKNLVEVHKYKDADHGFFCDARESYHKISADLAFSRSINFLKKFNNTGVTDGS